jgi:hypothetical protein
MPAFLRENHRRKKDLLVGEPEEQALLGVHPVPRLVEYDRLLSVHDLPSYLVAYVGGGTLACGVAFGYFIDQGYSAYMLAGFALVMQVGALVALRGDKKLFTVASNKA